MGCPTRQDIEISRERKNISETDFYINVKQTKGRVQIKKSREFSLTGGGLTPIPYLFYFLFCKIMYKRMLSDSDFWVLSEVQITLKYPTILWKIFNMNMNTLFSLVPNVVNCINKQRKFDPWLLKKITNKFPILLGGRGGLGDRGLPYFFF